MQVLSAKIGMREELMLSSPGKTLRLYLRWYTKLMLTLIGTGGDLANKDCWHC